jgi:polysaccharide pyruvyl transferase WcaK-like protein
VTSILLVGDNRDSINWGCRATSISLHQLLQRLFVINDVITKKAVDQKVPLSACLFGKLHLRGLQKIITSRKNSYLAQLFGRDSDFRRLNPEESARNLLRYRSCIPEFEFLYNAISQADAIVINGEGSMIFSYPVRKDLLYQLMVIELAKVHFQKPVFYVNAIVSDSPSKNSHDELRRIAMEYLAKCNAVSLRDPVSFEKVRGAGLDINCAYLPDALFSWHGYFENNTQVLPPNGDYIIPFPEENRYFGKFDFSIPYICIGGSSLSAKSPKQAVTCFADLVEKVKRIGLQVYLAQACSGDAFLYEVSKLTDVPVIPARVSILMAGAVLANARLFISGRYHPSIFASLGGTPCIFLGSNSHKTYSLQTVLGYEDPQEFPALPDEHDNDKIFELAKTILSQEEHYRQRIQTMAKKRGQEVVELLPRLISEHIGN